MEDEASEITSYEGIEVEGNLLYDINVVQLSPVEIKVLTQRKGPELFQKKYNIAYLVWETETIPQNFLEVIEFFDEVWTASSYCQKAFSDKIFKPVFCLPHAVDVDFLIQNFLHEFEQLPEDAFIFLNLFDFRSLIDRKNTLNLIKVFSNTFSHRDDVKLVLKSSPSDVLRKDVERIDYALIEAQNIIHICEVMTKEQIVCLLKQCDSYISLHRAEGFGLSLANAMALGKPTIATSYSGNMEFMNTFNSILIPYKLTKLDVEILHFDKETVWADPDLSSVAQAMSDLVNTPQKYERQQKQAEETVRKQLSIEAISKRIVNHMESIRNLLK